MEQDKRLKLRGFKEGKVSTHIEFEPYIPIRVKFPHPADIPKLYWRMVTEKSLLEVVVSPYTGQLVEVQITGYDNLDLTLAHEETIDSTGIPQFDIGVWHLWDRIIDSYGARFCDVLQPFSVKVSDSAIKINLFPEPSVKKIQVSSQFGCEFDKNDALIGFLITGLSSSEIDSFKAEIAY